MNWAVNGAALSWAAFLLKSWVLLRQQKLMIPWDQYKFLKCRFFMVGAIMKFLWEMSASHIYGVVEFGRGLCRWSRPAFLVKARSSREGGSAQCPVGVWISPWTEALELFWVIHSSVQPLSQVNGLSLSGISSISVCARFLWCFHGIPLRGAWICPFCSSPPSQGTHTDKIPLSLLCWGWTVLVPSFSPWQMLPSLWSFTGLTAVHPCASYWVA